MNAIHRLIPLAAACLAAGVVHAQTFHMSGSFSGIASASQLPLNFEPPQPASYFDGAPITGSFEFVMVDPVAQVPGSDPGHFANGPSGRLSLSYTVRGQTFEFDEGPGVFTLSSAAPALTVLTSFLPRHHGAWFTLDAPAGSLFDGLDPATLRLDPANPPLFETSFNHAGWALHVDVGVQQVSFSNGPPVPEPSTLALLAAGAAALGWRLRSGRG